MNCPYCGGKMREGCITAFQRSLSWYSDDEPREVISLSRIPIIGSGEVPAPYCPDCRKLLLDVPAPERVGEKLDKAFEVIDALTEKVEEAVFGGLDRRAEEKARREEAKKKSKDPWE